MKTPSIEEVNLAIRSVLHELARPRPTTANGARLVVERLFSLRHAEGLPPGTREVQIAPGTVITPLARDFLKRQDIGIRLVSRSEVEAARDPGQWGFAIDTDSGLVAAFRRSLLDDSRLWLELGPGVDTASRWVAESASRGAVLVTDEASVAVWSACQCPGVRAATACDLDSTARAVRRLGVNLLVVEPHGKSLPLLRQIGQAFRREGAPRLVERHWREVPT